LNSLQITVFQDLTEVLPLRPAFRTKLPQSMS